MPDTRHLPTAADEFAICRKERAIFSPPPCSATIDLRRSIWAFHAPVLMEGWERLDQMFRSDAEMRHTRSLFIWRLRVWPGGRDIALKRKALLRIEGTRLQRRDSELHHR